MRKTYKETLDLMNDFAGGIIQLNKMSDSDLSNIIVALEKQTPMKPIKTIEHNIGYYECPYCENKIGTDIMTYQSNHCGYCGQKLDWSK